MNGRQYTQGQTWYDGCQKKCVCEDGKTGFYRCSDRQIHFSIDDKYIGHSVVLLRQVGTLYYF